MKVVGYTDRLSVAPGETIRFMVSCELPTYRADIVRLIHGDTNPAGPGFKEEVVKTVANREYPGREQHIYRGSYVTVPDHPLLRCTESFTIQAWIYPTTPLKGVQGILTKWSAPDNRGYGLFVDEEGSLALWLGYQDRVEQLSTGVPMRPAFWYFVAGVYDVQKQRVYLYQEPITMWPRDETWAVVERTVEPGTPGQHNKSLLMAGYWAQEASGKTVVQGHFNGKIDSPRLFSKALTPQEIASLRQGTPPVYLGDAVLAAWDFARDFSSARITDTSPHRLHGQAVNMPARAMTGHNWKAKETNFTNAPDQYGAIHFHDDDLEDAGWDADFELIIPDTLKSGIYAARLQAGDHEDYVPFFVRPKRGTSTAPILFLVPTASYLAYANFHRAFLPENRGRWSRLFGRTLDYEYPVTPHDRYIVKHRLLSLYDRHTDGSGVCYSSRLRPILNMRPKYTMPILGGGTGAPHQFNADLHLTDWMETKGYQFDVVTDEDLHLEGVSVLSPYRVVVTGSHPEYWSGQMLDAMEAYLGERGRLMYLGGNGFYWVTSFAPQHPQVIEVRRWHGTEAWEAEPGEFYHSTTGELGGLWRFRGRAPQKLTGVGFTSQGFDRSLPYHRQPGSFDPRVAFIFEGIEKEEVIGDFGLVMGGAGGYEVDRADIALGTPPHALVLATATGFSDVYQHVVEEVISMNPDQGGTENPLARGDMVCFEGPKGGAVFSVGSISWCGSLSHNHYQNNVSRITDNVLRRFASAEPLP